MFRLILAMLYMLSAGCSTINFVNGPQMENSVEREQWHHIALLGLIELSRPMDVTYNCATQQWDTITVEKSFFNSLADASWPYVSIYSPMSIVYKCREPLD